MKKIVLLLAVLALPALIFASGNKQSDSNTLRFAWWGNPTRDERTLEVVRLFEQRNPGIKVERVLVAEGDNTAVDCFGFKTLNKNMYQAPEKFPYVFIIGKILKDGPESYQDVKGFVTSDYQTFLEEQWLKYLRAKYSVEIEKDVLNMVTRQ